MKSGIQIINDIYASEVYHVEDQIRTAIKNGEDYIITDNNQNIESEAKMAGYTTSHVLYDEDENLIDVAEDAWNNQPTFLKISWK